MSVTFGNGVSRTLTPEQRNFLEIVLQRGKPPLDADLNMAQQIPNEQLQQALRSLMPSGFLLDPTRSTEDFVTNQKYSNLFLFGNVDPAESRPVVYAHVNGWIVPIIGTACSTSDNWVRLSPPPGTDSRIDFVFLEVWQSLIAPNPSVVNKPSATTIWKYGNVEYGGTNVTDDLIDGSIGREVSKRVQLQYRIRVFGQGSGLGSTIALAVYPDGLDDPNVLAQGNATSPVGGLVFTNMKDELSDPGLWRAGDGNANNALGTIDGYVYAIPICAVFRRNSSTFTSFTLAGTSNNNGGFNRNPSASFLANPRTGAKEFIVPTLTAYLPWDYTGNIVVNDLANSGLDDPLFIAAAHKFITIGDEIIKISNMVAGTGTVTISERGRGGSNATGHFVGDPVKFFNHRPDGLFADEIDIGDILDLRHAVTPGEWDYNKLLQYNFTALLRNDLRSAWKKSATGDTSGPTVLEVDLLHADGTIAPPPDVEALDGPDGIRTIWSDASVIQSGVTILCDPNSPVLDNFTTGTLDSTVEWDIGADFKPQAFFNGGNGAWRNGTSIFLHIGGDTGSEGARATFRDGSTRGVRFLSPKEYWKENKPDSFWRTSFNSKEVLLRNFNSGAQNPVKINIFGERELNSPNWLGYGYEDMGYLRPARSLDFEKPFIFLGGLVHSSLRITGMSGSGGGGTTGLLFNPVTGYYEVDTGIDLSVAGEYWTDQVTSTGASLLYGPVGPVTEANDVYNNEINGITRPLLGGRKTIRELMTRGGSDRTGFLSELYIVLYGDTTNVENNGVFKVIGWGNRRSITDVQASGVTCVSVIPVCDGVAGFVIDPAVNGITCEFRSPYTTPEDGGGYASGIASAVVSLTDMGVGAGYNNSREYWRSLAYPSDQKLMISTTLLYDNNRSGFARIPKLVSGVNLYNNSGVLKQNMSVIDPTFHSESGVSLSNSSYEISQVVSMSQIQDNGLSIGDNSIPYFGFYRFMYNEQKIKDVQLRSAECFIDDGSKTLVFNPYRRNNMTIKGICTLFPLTFFTYSSGVSIDNANIFTANKQVGYPIPYEFMPKFGRHDIPCRLGSDSDFLDGINHLFCDNQDPTNPVFNIIGGADNTSGGNLVTSMYFQTGVSSGVDYGVWTALTPSIPAYQARLTTDIDPTSSDAAEEIVDTLSKIGSDDVGYGLRGIQLPPSMGIARLYGVYERSDFLAKGGLTFNSDRITPVVDPPTNLLNKGVNKQSLYILKDGATDVVLRNSKGWHTYIIPESMVDVSKIPSYVLGQSLEDFEYVVECVVFGFPYLWINGSNYVWARRHNGAGDEITDADSPELSGIPMAIPSPAPLNSRLYISYNRIPYQGDPYMTRNGDTIVIDDYTNRYGGFGNSSAIHLGSGIQQYEDGVRVVETPNLRSLEILSSLDFYTTLGTGSIGGILRPGTIMDVCHAENNEISCTRIPGSVTDPQTMMVSRAFTEGQKENKSRASLTMVFNEYGVPTEGEYFDVYFDEAIGFRNRYSGVRLTSAAVPANEWQFGSGASLSEIVDNLYNILDIDAAVSMSNLYNVLSTDYPKYNSIRFVSSIPGSVGNKIRFINHPNDPGKPHWFFLSDTSDSELLYSSQPSFVYNTIAYMSGGVDLINNAGTGSNPPNMVGITERLPLGILLQDSDFLGEDIANTGSSQLTISPSRISTQGNMVPYSDLDESSYDQILGGVGQVIAMSDGSILEYEPYNSFSSPTGTKRYRLYRGGGSVFISSGKTPGGPVDVSVEGFSKSDFPVLKGAVLFGKAMLVRNFKEQAFVTNNTVSYGDELQMVIVTHGKIGTGKEQETGLILSGTISPMGYGEGYAAADRYRMEARPLMKGYSRTVTDPSTIRLATSQRMVIDEDPDLIGP